MIYYLNEFVLFGVFIVSMLLFLKLFENDSIAYVMNSTPRYVLKISLIMICISQLHTMVSDHVGDIHYHDLLKDIGLFAFLGFIYKRVKL